jgi:hypothetical protein
MAIYATGLMARTFFIALIVVAAVGCCRSTEPRIVETHNAAQRVLAQQEQYEKGLDANSQWAQN